MKEKKNSSETGTSFKYIIFCLLTGLVGILVLWFLVGKVDKINAEMLELRKNTYLDNKTEYFGDLKNRFIPGEPNIYIVTDKYTIEDGQDIAGLGSVIEYKKPVLTLKDKKTNNVYRVEVTRDLYYETAVSNEFSVIESKNDELIKIQDTGDVFEKAELLN